MNVESDLFYDTVLGFLQESKNKEFYSLAGKKIGTGGNRTPHCTATHPHCMKLAKTGVQDDKDLVPIEVQLSSSKLEALSLKSSHVSSLSACIMLG